MSNKVEKAVAKAKEVKVKKKAEKNTPPLPSPKPTSNPEAEKKPSQSKGYMPPPKPREIAQKIEENPEDDKVPDSIKTDLEKVYKEEKSEKERLDAYVKFINTPPHKKNIKTNSHFGDYLTIGYVIALANFMYKGFWNYEAEYQSDEHGVLCIVELKIEHPIYPSITIKRNGVAYETVKGDNWKLAYGSAKSGAIKNGFSSVGACFRASGEEFVYINNQK